jgi:transcription termination/antitermination protein NusG
MDSEKNWYVIHTYSGYENKVKANLEKKVHSMAMENEIFRVIVPMEDEVEYKDGKKKISKKKVFPGYVLVEMIVNDRSWYVVRNTPGVTGFVGSGTKPIPLTATEVKHIMKSMGIEDAKPKKFDVNLKELVRITSGAFENWTATVTDIDTDRGKLRVLVDMFGRETPVELDYTQIEKLQ